MTKLKVYKQLLTTNGIQVQGTGCREIALKRADAVRALELLQEQGLAVLGGDVYFDRGGSLEPGYANWHSDQGTGESLPDYVARSCGEAHEYIARFPHDVDRVPMFVLVVRE